MRNFVLVAVLSFSAARALANTGAGEERPPPPIVYHAQDAAKTPPADPNAPAKPEDPAAKGTDQTKFGLFGCSAFTPEPLALLAVLGLALVRRRR
jgi:hypothetical protein